MNNIQKINDIKYLIIEHYSDKEPLTDNQKASRQCFLNYCDDIKNSLVRLEKLEKVVEILKPYIEISSEEIISCHNLFLSPICESYKEEYNLLKEVFNNGKQIL